MPFFAKKYTNIIKMITEIVSDIGDTRTKFVELPVEIKKSGDLLVLQVYSDLGAHFELSETIIDDSDIQINTSYVLSSDTMLSLGTTSAYKIHSAKEGIVFNSIDGKSELLLRKSPLKINIEEWKDNNEIELEFKIPDFSEMVKSLMTAQSAETKIMPVLFNITGHKLRGISSDKSSIALNIGSIDCKVIGDNKIKEKLEYFGIYGLNAIISVLLRSGILKNFRIIVGDVYTTIYAFMDGVHIKGRIKTLLGRGFQRRIKRFTNLKHLIELISKKLDNKAVTKITIEQQREMKEALKTIKSIEPSLLDKDLATFVIEKDKIYVYKKVSTGNKRINIVDIKREGNTDRIVLGVFHHIERHLDLNDSKLIIEFLRDEIGILKIYTDTSSVATVTFTKEGGNVPPDVLAKIENK